MFRQGIGEKSLNCHSKTKISTTTTEDDLLGFERSCYTSKTYICQAVKQKEQSKFKKQKTRL